MSNSIRHLRMVVPSAVLICGLPFFAGPAHAGDRTSYVNKPPLSIEVQDERGNPLAGPETHPTAVFAVLEFEHEYQPGDRIMVRGPRQIAVQLERNMPECIIYRSAISDRQVSFDIPYGSAENQTGSAFAPGAFAGRLHRVTVRILYAREIHAYRNLALNPCDQLRPEGSPQLYPHASSNSVSRSLFDFEARNAIDGITQNGHHGVWPYQSWGPQLRTDIWWKVEFGRPVEVDKVRLMVRADFPHDSYWKSADIEFSDGSRVPMQIEPSAEFQEFSFPKRTVSWFRIINVVPADPTKWCSFIEVEAWGRDLQ